MATPLDTLPDFTEAEYGKALAGHLRCRAVGLPLGDCRQPHAPDSHYCYYHDKLQKGLMDPSVPTPDVGPAAFHEMDGIALYPVWPLPEKGYVILDDEAQLVVA